MPRPHDCGHVPDIDSPFCGGCGGRVGQEREHAARCLCGRMTWNPDAICQACRSEHEDEVGERMADAW